MVALAVLGTVALAVLAAGAVFARHRRALGSVRERAERARAEIAAIQGADCARPPFGSSAVAGNAWDFYARAFDQHAALAGGAEPGSLPFGADLEALMTADTFDAARADALLTQFGEPIGLVRLGLNRSHACSPFDRNLGFEAPMPSMQAARSLGQLMLLDARRSETRGDLADATVKALEVIAYAQDLERHGSLLCAIVGASLERSTLVQLERLVANGALGDRSLSALEAQLTAFEASRPPFVWAIRDERLGLVAGLAGVSERGSGAQPLDAATPDASSPAVVWRVHSWLFTPQIAEAIEVSDEYYRALEEQAAAPFATFKTRAQQMNESLEANGNAVLAVVVPAFDVAARGDAIVRAQMQLVLLAARLERVRRTTGALPATVSEVATGPSARLLVDPLNGEPFGYRAEHGGAALWSVGANLENDNGRPSVDDNAPAGDIVVRIPARNAAAGGSRGPIE